MAEVQFGRRKGSVRSPGCRGSLRHGRSWSAEVEDVKPCQEAVIPAAEWQRIKESLSHREREGQEQCEARQRRKDRKLQSQSIVKHWENTIEGQRLKKLQARELREEKEEQERIKIDCDEMEFQAQCRKEAIERAKMLLYHQTDHVKTFHGALLLSEVLRERDAQLEYKKKRQEAAKRVDQKHICMQEEERGKGIAADQNASIERAKAKHETSKFHAMQIAEKQRQRVRARDEDYAEQKMIDKEVEEFLKTQATLLAKKTEAQLQLRAELDQGVREKAERDVGRQQQYLTEAQGIELFKQAKKRMTHLRKEKEGELFQQFQSRQQRMAELLQKQRQQERNMEDEAIAKDMEEQLAKEQQAEREKERLFMERTRDIQKHRIQMMTKKEHKEREEREADQEMLQQKRAHDLKFHRAQQEKAVRAHQEATELQQFLRDQVAERKDQKKAEEREDREINGHNRLLMEVEQRQFQEYADNVISMARARGAPIQPLVRAVQAGTGGGKGPVFTGKAGVRPSYQAMDSTAVELPSYQPKAPPTPANTQNRMGFTW